MIRRTALAGWAALALSSAACGGGEAPPREAARPVLSFDTTRVRVVSDGDTIPLTVELAESEVQRSYGLMQRDSLPEGHGMLFTYERVQPPTAGFWMWRTRIPLDIAFLDETGRIVAIRTMQPCDRPDPVCPSYEPGAAYRSALEVPAGWFEARGVELGDRVERAGGAAPPASDPPSEPLPE
ncbi:MAG: DUF192 domain-containing protein [Gemmatimonadota bacterium]|nr:DUF192 domain-containing protein [Gemmatimonadota bacterium]